MPDLPQQPGDGESFQLKLRLSADAVTGAYRVTIELLDVDLQVEVLDVDLRRALRTAADRCAERLREIGFAVTSTDVIGALEEALESSELVSHAPEASN